MRMTKEDVIKSMQSYQKAMEEILDICHSIGVDGTGTARFFLDGRFENNGIKSLDIIHLANQVTVSNISLLDWGNPKIINENTHMWHSGFFTAMFWIFKDYQIYMENRIINSQISLKCDVGSYGLKNWDNKRDEIEHLFDNAPEKIKEEYKKQYEEADKKVELWRAAMQKICVPFK